MPSTPKQKAVETKSSSSKMRQLSLMSFFKPEKPQSSPLLSKQTYPIIKDEVKESKKVVYHDSDKENDADISIELPSHETPLTLECDANFSSKLLPPQSSPIPTQPSVQPIDEPKRPQEGSSPLSKRGRARKSTSYAESDDEDVTVKRKKTRRIDDSDDDEDEFKAEDLSDDDDDMSDFIDDEAEPSAEEAEDIEILDAEEEVVKPRKKPRKSSPKNSPSPVSTTETTNVLGEKFKAGSSYSAQPKQVATKLVTKAAKSPPKNFAKENEERYQWLVNVRDAEKRTMDDPNYDPRTLYIPQSAWSKFTAFEKQYWEIKGVMWDTVVFFKKGKFYELYENDATIANSEFDLKIAGGGRANMKLAGIPEMSFEYWAKEFISHGYKVAKVDQKESLLAKEMRGGGTKEEKIIKRELTGVLTGGTLTDLNMLSDDMSTYCLSIKQFDNWFGVVFVDTATSELNFYQFEDDNECTKLETLVTHVRPKEVICEKHNLSSTATKILKYTAQPSNQIWNTLNPNTEFWDYDTTLEKLVSSKYYDATDLDDFSNYPDALIAFKDKNQYAFSAFGGLLSYLKFLKLDHNIMTMGNIREYQITTRLAKNMILDGITLNNLEILTNSFDGSDKGTLFKLLNRAQSPFGKRMLKNWVLNPLMVSSDINDRLDSVEYLMGEGAEIKDILEKSLLGLPDLERLIARTHSKNIKFKDFLKLIEGFEKVCGTLQNLKDFVKESCGSLYKYLQGFPTELKSCVNEWEDAFDRSEALNDVVVPATGVDESFDASSDRMKKLEDILNEHLRKYKKEYRSNEICYKDSGKEIYLIEVPNKVKNIPSDWHQMGSTSKVKRFWSPEVKKLARELMEQRETHKMVCETLRFRMYERFCKHYKVWKSTIHVLANIDCIIALTKTSETLGQPSCRPQFVEADTGLIDFKDLRNPCFVTSGEFIPNDVSLGGDEAHFGLLTGANAAGKSTLMRTTAMAVVMSQIGCFVPASHARLTPVDKIMTRLGANDNILQGKSTFFVELSETKKILANATAKSLVILDELGRGGSSSDGFAIAEAVLHHLATHVQPLGFFATHYGSLVLSFEGHPQIRPLRMAIVIDQNSRNITFLYKLEDGTAPGSFGMNVAAMCGISSEIVDQAEVAAIKYEQTSMVKKAHVENPTKMSLGLQSDISWLSNSTKNIGEGVLDYNAVIKQKSLKTVFDMIGTI
ncbi:hypothetical protein QFC19_005049 [Naganishia cerealis]|uniref:Uncharacterized protein n=1 Tax=Naganishia cerealis TaxID=610337 RepID=A0ACC2VSX5_9TREE|nr:hypothetical protein QFC19_005049 [Naganishia cerealis]